MIARIATKLLSGKRVRKNNFVNICALRPAVVPFWLHAAAVPPEAVFANGRRTLNNRRGKFWQSAFLAKILVDSISCEAYL
jgi:hypothetical protein